MTRRRQPGKRLLDLVVSIVALALLSPLCALAAMLVVASMGRPVLFRQQRPGLDGRPFELLKFRTMTDERESDGRLKPDSRRLTRVGRWLRKTSLDELPQLWNVVRGEMSLVGPRPLLMEYMPNYTREQRRRHDVLPGITGWAQIHGRNGVVFSERLGLDVWYVDHWSLALDLKILGRTVLAVMRASRVRLEAPLEEVDDVGLHPDTREGGPMVSVPRKLNPDDLRT